MTKGAAALNVVPGLTVSLTRVINAMTVQKIGQGMHAQLPDEIIKAGKRIAVNNGSFPPYESVNGPHPMGAVPATCRNIMATIRL